MLDLEFSVWFGREGVWVGVGVVWGFVVNVWLVVLG